MLNKLLPSKLFDKHFYYNFLVTVQNKNIPDRLLIFYACKINIKDIFCMHILYYYENMYLYILCQYLKIITSFKRARNRNNQ